MDLEHRALELSGLLRSQSLRLSLAESCTGGMVCAALTEIAGSSDVLDRGFVTYSNAAKVEMLGVEASLIDRFGAVSLEVAQAMAQGALAHSQADVSASITGIAGPSGGSVAKPVGLVWFGVARRGEAPLVVSRVFEGVGRHGVRVRAVGEVFDLISQVVGSSGDSAGYISSN